MSDKNDLKLAESAFSEIDDLAADDLEGEIREPLKPAPGKAKKGTSTRVLLLLLLLVAAAAGAFFYLGGTPEPAPVAAPAPVKKQPIPMPKPAPEPAAVEQAAAGSPASSAAPTEPEPTLPAAKKVEASSAATAAKKEAAAAAPVEKKVEPVSAVAEAAPKSAALADKVETPAPSAIIVEKVETPAPAAAPVGQYTVEVGSFLLEANRREAEKIIGRLGHQAEAVTIRRPVQMVRLRVGSYPPAAAEEKLAAISPVAPDAFTLRQGDEVAVYAGSYVSLDKARSFADRLFLHGIEIEEETAQVPMNLVRLTFGSFPDQAAAREAAARAQAAGLDATVVSR